MRNIHKLLLPCLLISIYFFIYSPFLWGLFFYSITIIGTIVTLCLENRTHYATIMWIYTLIFIPVLGYLFYLFSGELDTKGFLFKQKRKALKEHFNELRQTEDTADYSNYDDEVYQFIKFANKVSISSVSSKSEATILTNGPKTFEDMFDKIDQAKKYICVEFYIFRTDELGICFLEKLMNKAKEGVKIYLLIDFIGSWRFSRKWVKILRQSGVNIQFFSPIKVAFLNYKMNFRNHRKIVVIDGEVGYIGGLNVGNEYISKSEEGLFWRDTHMKVEGEAVQTLYHLFSLDWSYCNKEALDIMSEAKAIPCNNGGLQVVASGPDTNKGLIADFYFNLITSAKKSIWIASPYFVPNETIRTSLRIASQKGVEVKLLLPKKNDGFLTQYASQSYFSELLQYGVDIYLYEKGFLHQKIIIVDGLIASLGTANVDMRSFHLNFEANVFLYQNTAIRKLSEDFLNDLEDSEKLSPTAYYKRSFIIKCKESFARLFSGSL